jgi:hypothetical protein
MTSSSEMVRLQSDDAIKLPSDVKLAGDHLAWRFKRELPEPDSVEHSGWPEYPVKNCLTDFIELRNADGEGILAFVKKHGFLGVYPIVREEGPLYPDAREWILNSSAYYEEPVSLYRSMAQACWYIVDTMRWLKKGEGRVPGGYPPGVSHPQWYQKLVFDVGMWSHASTLKLEFRGGKEGRGALSVSFGSWYEGFQWEDNEWCRDGVRSPLEELFLRAKMYIPLSTQRPSPLFNVLCFQLLKEVALEENSYWCTTCSGYFIHTPDIGMSKPRKDKSVAFCSLLCRDNYRDKYQREYKRTHPQTVKKTTVPLLAEG